LTAASKKPKQRIPPGLARVRKEIPPPGKIFKSKKRDPRKQAKEELCQELKESFPRKSS
jgi:hypothetical protein